VWDAANSSLSLGSILVASIVAAGALAEDRRTRYARLVLSRGYSRRTYALAKALAMALSGGLVTGLGLGGFLLLAWIQLPVQGWTISIPDLLLPLAMLSLSAAGLSVAGFLAGTISSNVYVASAMPIIVIIATGFLLGRNPWSPAFQIDAWQHVVRPRSLDWPAPYVLLYWVAFSSLIAVLGAEIFSRTERD
jgi:ABC-type transport system involved in multi-copper enzyme maturation permease subunit